MSVMNHQAVERFRAVHRGSLRTIGRGTPEELLEQLDGVRLADVALYRSLYGRLEDMVYGDTERFLLARAATDED